MNLPSAKRIHVTGLVQGVGFRPFIYLLAEKHKISGWVENRNDGVMIHAEGNESSLQTFIEDIREKAPLAASIFSIQHKESTCQGCKDFRIVKSNNISEEITEVSPDIAVCEQCLHDMKTQPHRLDYPFINCTHCGPRFTIIKDLPYDREQTTLSDFTLCETCASEYRNIRNRRFHAQPVACNSCGPVYSLYYNNQKLTDFQEILKTVAKNLTEGEIVAMKGLGGFHLACNAVNEAAVRKLRSAKIREGKPFAVMFRNLETLQRYSDPNKAEKKLLTSWQRPIVLLKMKKQLAPSVANGISSTGVMLPYMPFHYQLFDKTKLDALVLTSGNFSDEPILIDNDKAIKELSPITSAVLTYNRNIQNRTDDSVAFVANSTPQLIRRSRGYVPSPVYLQINTEGIFASGAELVNCFAIGKGRQAILSQHIGDLQNPETLDFYEESYNSFKKLFRFRPTLVVHDHHPDYFSTKFAKSLGIPLIAVQHHHAHIASVMAEHGLDEDILGVSFDGTGLGDDGHIWGAEFFICNLYNYQRMAHFEYIPMPGGDMVTHEPWRMALSYLYHYFGKEVLEPVPAFLKKINSADIEILTQAINKKINCPLSSSAGRLFDAVSALLNICPVSTFHAEAPMRLESAIVHGIKEIYPFENDGRIISFKPAFSAILQDIQERVNKGIIVAKFHNTIIEVIISMLIKIRDESGITKVALSGGTFQNRYLLEQLEIRLIQNHFELYLPVAVPANDGGLALGQLAIAAKKRELGIIS